MGLVDVSEVLNDPTFVDPITLVRRTEKVDNSGQTVLVEYPNLTVGSVQPISGKTLSRIPEAFRVANVQEFWLREKIITDSRAKYPDIIIRNGIRYAVQVVFDWSDWGGGWNQGTCVAESPTGGY